MENKLRPQSSFQPPKYINSAESAVFQKNQLLFGLHLAKKVARKEKGLVVVEGYMDAIALHSSGVENVVACLGVAVTETQLMRCCELIQASAHIETMCEASEASMRARGSCTQS